MVSLRKARIEDTQAYYRLQKACFPESCLDFESACAELSRYQVMLAEDDRHNLLGYICFGEDIVYVSSNDIPTSVFYISSFGVDPAVRGRKIGHALLAACLTEAKIIAKDNPDLVVLADRKPGNLTSGHLLAAHGLPARFGVIEYYLSRDSRAEIHWQRVCDL